MISRRWSAYSSMIRRASSERDSWTAHLYPRAWFVGRFHVAMVGPDQRDH